MEEILQLVNISVEQVLLVYLHDCISDVWEYSGVIALGALETYSHEDMDVETCLSTIMSTH